jgi:putative ABC transport system permease protein
MLAPTLLKTGLRDLLRRPLHTALLVLGVALGVAVVVAIDLANESAQRGFLRSTEAVVGSATHQVLGGPAGLPGDVLRRLRVDGRHRATAPIVEGLATAVELDGEPLRILGVDPLSEAPFRPHLGGGTVAEAAFARFFTDPRAVLVGSSFAGRHALAPGSRLRLRIDDRFEEVTVLGIVTPADAGQVAALDGLLLMDVGAAQRLLGLGDRLTRIDVIATEAEARHLAALLPPGARLAPASEQSGAVAQLSDAFALNLRALSLLALVVGMFLIYNTVMFSVVQRRAVFGTLRALGVTPGQLLALILAEAAAASALGSALGVGLGYALGQGAVGLVTQTINDLYYVVSVRGAPLTSGSVLKGLGLGLGAGLLAALLPGLEAARVEPVLALRPSTFDQRSRRLLPWAGAAGAALALGGAALLLAATRSLVLSFAGLFAVVLGIALLTPLVTIGLMRAALPLASLAAGSLGRVATRTVVRAVSRTGVAVAALMVAVSVTIGVGLMIGSFRSTVDTWLGLALRADVYVGAPARGRSAPTLAPDVRQRVAAVPGVARVESFRLARVASPRGEVELSVVDPVAERAAGLYRVAEGGAERAWQRVLEGAVLVSEPFAYRHRVPDSGGEVTLLTDRGLRSFPVAGIYYDYATERGAVMMARGVYERHWDDRALSSLGVYVEEGVAAPEVADRLRKALTGTALQVTENRSLRRSALAIFDRTFAVTQALRVLAVVVAFIGVWSALMALQVERTRELATLVALGLTPARLAALTFLETGLMGAAAGLLSLPTGTLLATALVEVINVRSFGWTMRLELAPGLFVQAVAVSVAAAVLAAVYPLWRLQRMPLAEGLRLE